MTQSPAMRRIVILSGMAKGAAYELDGETIRLGREDDNAIVLDDTEVSRAHAELNRDGPEYRLRDLGSRNGTRVNGQVITQTRLSPGDRIQFGTVEARYEVVLARVAPPPPSPPVPLALPKPAAAAVAVTAPTAAVPPQNREPTARLDAKPREPAPVPVPSAPPAQRQATTELAQPAPKATNPEIERLRRDQAQMRLELQAAKGREAAAAVHENPAGVGALAKQVADLQKQNAELLEQLAAAQKQAALAKTDAPAAEELQRLRSELTLARAQLFNLGVVTPHRRPVQRQAPTPAPAAPPAAAATIVRPAADPPAPKPPLPVTPAPARPPPRARSKPKLVLPVIGLAIVGLLALAIWYWQSRGGADARRTPADKGLPARSAGPVGSAQPTHANRAQLVVSLGLPADSADALYVDPQDRFVCVVPPGWQVEPLPDQHQSRLRLRSGNHEILVTSHGSTWPDLGRNDQPRVAEDVRLRLLAEYGKAESRLLGDPVARVLEGKLAFGFIVRVSHPAGPLDFVTVEYRNNGRANSIELRGPAETKQSALSALFETFLVNFRSRPDPETLGVRSLFE